MPADERVYSSPAEGRSKRPDFDIAMDHILTVEGKAFTDHPLDKGGPTKFGITLADLREYRGDPKLTGSAVRDMEEDEARKIYKAKYWDKMNLGFLTGDFRVALALFDQGVNRGTKTAIMMAQQMLNNQKYYGRQQKPLTVDGVLGPVTQSLLNDVSPDFFCRELIQSAQHGYLDIVQRKPDQMVFLKGWLNRTHILEDICWQGTNRMSPEPVPVPKPDLSVVPPVKKVLDQLKPFQWAVGELGQSEISGSKDNARIVYYHSFTSLHATDDETAWCSSFVNAAGSQFGYKVTRSAAAKSWDTYGVEGSGAVGNIVTLRHPNGGRHVCFLARAYKKGDSTIYVLGGNQANKVCYQTYSASEIVAIREWVAA